MGFAKIKGQLTSRIGCRVQFTVPKDVKLRGDGVDYGEIVDEVWADPDINKSSPRKHERENDWGDYSFCAQLIKWDEEEYSIRLAYYRRRAGEDFWEFASQMSVNSNWQTIKALLEKTLAKKQWFKDNPIYPNKCG